MPELAEVEFYRKQWDPGLGQTIQRVHLHPQARIFRDTSPSRIRRELKGSEFVASFAHGKNLLFQFSEGRWLGGHLGMTGKMHTGPPDYRPEKHDHLVLSGEKAALIFTDPRMFGRIHFDRSAEDEAFPAWWQALPPEILSKRFTKAFVADYLARHPKTPIKTLLLDQDAFPGIGNWMADEVCWRVGIHPATPSGQLVADGAPFPSTLWKVLRQVCRQSIRVIADDWSRPPNDWLFNHRWKDGGRCPRKGCGADLLRAELRGRRTCWCPRCQGKDT